MKHNSRGRVVAFILVLALTISVMPMPTVLAGGEAAVRFNSEDGKLIFIVLTEDEGSNTGTVKVLAANKTISGTLEIPEYVTNEGITYTVTEINDGGFADCKNITGDLVIPNTVTYIGYRAFYKCNGLNGTLSLGTSVNTIDAQAFISCQGLNGTLTIPSSVKVISGSAFSGCVSFNKLTILNGVETIGDTAFNYCTGLLGNLLIPDSVKNIGDAAFAECTGFTGNLVIPDAVTSIGANAFENCSGLNGTLTLGSAVEFIGTYAFTGANLNGNLELPNSLVYIDDLAFYQCSTFTGALTIPNNVTYVGEMAFYECTGFTGNITIGTSVREIGKSAFPSLNITGPLTIPNSVEVIGKYAFEFCEGLSGNLTLGNGLKDIGLAAFLGCSGLKGNITIPDTMVTIGASSFYGTSISGIITIPESVEKIGGDAFSECNGITHVTFEGDTLPVMGNSIFYGIEDLTITCPAGAVAGFIAATSISESKITRRLSIKPDNISVTPKLFGTTNPAIVRVAGFPVYNSEDVTVSVSGEFTGTTEGATTVNLSNWQLGGNDAGKYTLPSASKLPATAAGMILKGDDLGLAVVTVSGIHTYSGQKIEPPVEVSFKGNPLSPATDYTIAYENNTNAGIGKVIIAGKGNYIGKTEAQFQIRKKVPTAGDLAYAKSQVHQYNGSPQGIGDVTFAGIGTGIGNVTVKYGGSTQVPKSPNQYLVTADISEGANYSAAAGIDLGNYIITAKTITMSGITVEDKMYDGTVGATVSAITLEGDIDSMESGTDFTVSATYNSANVNEANAVTVKVTLNNTDKAKNYVLSTDTAIISKSITKANIGMSASVTGGSILIDENDTDEKSVNLNEIISLTAEGAGAVEYELSTFNDNDSILAGKPTQGGVGGAVLNYKGVGATGGAATLEVLVKSDNYETLPLTITFEAISKQDTNITVTTPANITYGQTLGAPSAVADAGGSNFTYSYSGTIEGGATYEPTSEKPTKPGSYILTATLNSETHKGSGTASFTISKKTLAWNGDGEANSKTYDGTTVATIKTAPTLNGIVGSDSMVVSAGTIYFADGSAGETVQVSSNGWGVSGTNAAFYNAPLEQPLFATAVINKKELSWDTNGAVESKVYDGTAVATVSTQPTLSGILSRDEGTVRIVTGSAAFSDSNVGVGKSISASGWSISQHVNYIAPSSQPVFSNGTITKATASGKEETITVIENLAKSYSFDLKNLIPTEVDATQIQGFGLVSGESNNTYFSNDASISGTKLEIKMKSVPAETSAASIVISLSSINYDISNAKVTIHVSAKDRVTVSGITASNKTYDGSAYSYSGSAVFKNMNDGNADITTSIAAVYEYSSNGAIYGTAAPTNAGDYYLRVSGQEHVNYYVEPLVLQFNITKAALVSSDIVCTAPSNLTYDGTGKAASLSFNLSGKTGYGTLSAVYEGINGTSYSSSTPPVNAGTYNVLANSTGGTNYNDISNVQVGTFAITAAAIGGSVLINEQSNAGTVGVIDVNDVLSVDTAGLTPSGAATGLSYQWYLGNAEAGTGAAYTVPSGSADEAITVKVTASGNYRGELTSNPVTVGKASLTGSAMVAGETTLAGIITFTPTAFSGDYDVVWMRDGVEITRGGVSTHNTYIVTKDDLGKTITAKASGKGDYTGEIIASGSAVIPAIVPDAPVLSVSQGDGQITVSWTKPFDGGSEITAYEVQISSGQAMALSGSSLSHKFTGLVNGQSYIVKVAAVNGAGVSQVSTISAIPKASETIGGSGNSKSPAVDKDVLNEVQEKPNEQQKNPYSDVKEGDWCYDAILFMSESGLMIGTSESTFGAQDNFSRAMLVTILSRIAGEPEPTKENAFKDISQDWYKNAVLWANENGIVDGFGDGIFGPEESITRQQLATMLYRYAKWAGMDVSARADLSTYVDAGEISDWALEAMSWANAKGLITGRSQLHLVPGETATRAEAAAILHRFMQQQN